MIEPRRSEYHHAAGGRDVHAGIVCSACTESIGVRQIVAPPAPDARPDESPA